MLFQPLHGLGAPYWNQNARGSVFGLTRGTSKRDFIKATLQSIAYQVRDIIDTMQVDAQTAIQVLKVDGGAAMNNFLMQFQADILGIDIARAKNLETTALGAAFLAGLSVGYWKDLGCFHSFLPALVELFLARFVHRWLEELSCLVQEFQLIQVFPITY